MNSQRAILRKLVPVSLALVGAWLMAGCLKLPIWEYRSFDKQHDFRSELGDSHSKRPVRPGAINKDQVIARFGRPFDTSKDGRSIQYLLETNRAVYIWPLCFNASPAEQRLYTLDLRFDDGDRLLRWNLSHQDRRVNWFMDRGHMMPSRPGVRVEAP